MSNYLVVDASLWVARLVAGDVFHALSRAWLEKQRAAHWVEVAQIGI